MSASTNARSNLPRTVLGLSPRTLRNLWSKGASELISKAIRLLGIVLAARWLGLREFGAYSYALSLGYMLVQFADLGLQFYLAREIARDRPNAPRILGTVLRCKLLLGTCVVVLVFLAGVAAESTTKRSLIWILGLSLLLSSFVELAYYLFRGYQRLEHEARIQLLSAVATTFLGLAAVRVGLGPIGLAAGSLLGALAACLVAWITVSRRFVSPAQAVATAAKGLGALRASLPIGISILLSILYFRIDVLFLEHWHGTATVGLYSAAYKIVESLMFLPAIFLAAVFPVFSEMTEREPTRLNALLRSSLLWMLTVSVVLVVVLSLGSGLILRWMFGEEYLPGLTALRILLPSLVPIFLNYALTHFLIALGQVRWNAVCAATCLLVNVLGNWLFVPRFGMEAAAAVTIATEAVLFGLAFLVVRRSVRERSMIHSLGLENAS